ncbi:uncharacterized protein N7484_004681 [Penicillium longicatenatum]|uniref:uncharacterized protein n=1 Tax=Penicillium longicatenatum TaxID=1561947 RepID=UPI002548D960|nr:uncharacterized protein N7484_004681 [Penicillium longicatenatum]KAJ5650958.1 hypothetical protein N7484_004681 [Penicillium longicatenatum]
MERVVIVGAGLYGLVAAKTYLQVKGAYAGRDNIDPTAEPETIPSCFTQDGYDVKYTEGCHLLVLDAASDIGGTWAEERLYPNLLSQNSYGLYEFSDLSLADVVPSEQSEGGSRFIPGWKINRYLHSWVAKWDLQKHIKLNSKVNSISRLETKQWSLNVAIADRCQSGHERTINLICDKLILATGLTSVPNLPKTDGLESPTKNSSHVIHAKDIGGWSRANLDYQPLPKPDAIVENTKTQKYCANKVRSVVVYGGAKSSFDLVHLFATLHRKDPTLHLKFTPESHVEVHWIIRANSPGPAWMVPPTSSLPNGDVVASDKANWKVSSNGSWLARIFHGNPFGRWWMRWLWKSIDWEMEKFAQYDVDAKMQLLRPNKSIFSCGASAGIANQRDLWDTIRSPNVKVYRSTIQSISEPFTKNDGRTQQGVTVSMTNGGNIDNVDLVLHATGYKPIVPIKTTPSSFRLTLGLSGIAVSEPQEKVGYKSDNPHNAIEVPLDATTEKLCQYWQTLDSALEPAIKQRLLDSGCVPLEKSAPSWSGPNKFIQYRLFRRMVAPELVAEGDRSFATLGIVLGSTIAIIAEVQALWIAGFLTGGFDNVSTGNTSYQSGSLYLADLPKEIMNQEISEDCVLGSLIGSGLEVGAIDYNDLLMRDLGLNPYRLGGGRLKELTGVYEPHVYAGIVEEWLIRREFLYLSSLS